MITINELLNLKIPTLEDERNRLLAKIPNEFYKDEGSIFYDVFSVIANENIEILRLSQSILLNSFGLFADGVFLDYKVQEVGIERKLGRKASGVVTFTGLLGTEIPFNTVVLCDNLQYITVKDSVIGDSGTVDIEIVAVEVGYKYNVKAHNINKIGTTIQGITSVDNSNAISNGISDETDEELRARYLIKVREPATSGNAYHYKKWALEVEGIGNCKVYPLHNGPGTVKLLLIGANGSILSSEKIQEVSQHIELVRPIGATVTVDNAQVLNIRIRANIVKSSLVDLELIKKDFEEKLNVYISNVNLKSENISYGKVTSLLYNVPGILDFSNLTINGSSNSVNINETQVAVLSELILNE